LQTAAAYKWNYSQNGWLDPRFSLHLVLVVIQQVQCWRHGHDDNATNIGFVAAAAAAAVLYDTT